MLTSCCCRLWHPAVRWRALPQQPRRRRRRSSWLKLRRGGSSTEQVSVRPSILQKALISKDSPGGGAVLSCNYKWHVFVFWSTAVSEPNTFPLPVKAERFGLIKVDRWRSSVWVWKLFTLKNTRVKLVLTPASVWSPQSGCVCRVIKPSRNYLPASDLSPQTSQFLSLQS